MKKKFKHSILTVFFALTALCILMPSRAYSNIQLSGTWSGGEVSLNWTELPDSSGTVVYSVYETYGIGQMYTSDQIINQEVSSMASTYETSITFSGYGTQEYRVRAEDEGGQVAVSNVAINRYLSKGREYDGEGATWGFGQIWYIPITLQHYSYLSAYVFDYDQYDAILAHDDSHDENGFLNNPMDNGFEPKKIIEDYYLWPYGMDETVPIEWGWKDEDGKILPVGTYYVYFEAFDDDKNSSRHKRDARFKKLTINEPRYMDLQAQGMPYGASSSNITFKSNMDSYAKLIIASPGTTFRAASEDGTAEYLDGAYTYEYEVGDPIPVSTETWEDDFDSIIRVISNFQPAGGVTLQWDGQDQAEDRVGSGIYQLAITGRNSYDEIFVTEGGWSTSLTVNRSPVGAPEDPDGPDGPDDPDTPTSSPPQLVELDPEDEEVVKESISEISMTLATQDPFTVKENYNAMELRGPEGQSYSHNNGAEVNITGTQDNRRTFTMTLDEGLTTDGEYMIFIEGETLFEGDVVDKMEETTVFYLDIDREKLFEKSIKAYPQPAEDGYASIEYEILKKSNISIEVFNLMQEEVFRDDFSRDEEGVSVYTWEIDPGVAPGVYFYRVTADNGREIYSAIKRLVIVQ